MGKVGTVKQLCTNSLLDESGILENEKWNEMKYVKYFTLHLSVMSLSLKYIRKICFYVGNLVLAIILKCGANSKKVTKSDHLFLFYESWLSRVLDYKEV